MWIWIFVGRQPGQWTSIQLSSRSYSTNRWWATNFLKNLWMYDTVHPLVNRWRGEYRNLPPVDGSSRRERDFWLSKCSRCKSTQVKVNFDSFNFELIESILIFLNFVVRWRWCSQFWKNVVENLSMILIRFVPISFVAWKQISGGEGNDSSNAIN